MRAIEAKLGITGFAVDLAADSSNYQASCYFTQEEDSLDQDWRNLARSRFIPGPQQWFWLNPPYANIGDWVQKCVQESFRWEYSSSGVGVHIAVLIPASVGSNWWRDWVHKKARVLFLNGRITFEGHDQAYPKDCAILLYGPDVTPGYEVWKWRD